MPSLPKPRARSCVAPTCARVRRHALLVAYLCCARATGSSLAGQAVAQFDLATALTKKEGRVIRKAEYMIPYHMARCPNYGWKESEEYQRAEELKEKIGGIEAKAKKRWDASFI